MTETRLQNPCVCFQQGENSLRIDEMTKEFEAVRHNDYRTLLLLESGKGINALINSQKKSVSGL